MREEGPPPPPPLTHLYNIAYLFSLNSHRWAMQESENLSVQHIVEFIDHGGNVLLAASPNIGRLFDNVGHMFIFVYGFLNFFLFL